MRANDINGMPRFAKQYRSDTPLDDFALERVAPSIFAEHPAEAMRRDSYAFFPTIKIIDRLRHFGFQPFAVSQTRAKESNRQFTKHLVRLRHPDTPNLNGTFNEVLLMNSHNGSSVYRIMAGLFRMVCSNGMVVAERAAAMSVRHHSKNQLDDVIEGSFRVIEESERVNEQQREWAQITLSEKGQVAFAEKALALRWNPKFTPILPTHLLVARRTEDAGSDLWSVFNRVQENLTQGGITSKTPRGRRVTTVPLRGVTADLRVNRELWRIAEETAEAMQ